MLLRGAPEKLAQTTLSQLSSSAEGEGSNAVEITSCIASTLVVTSMSSDGGVEVGKRSRAADKVLMASPYNWSPW